MSLQDSSSDKPDLCFENEIVVSLAKGLCVNMSKGRRKVFQGRVIAISK